MRRPWLRAAIVGVLGALVGTIGGLLLGLEIGRHVYADCVEMECLSRNIVGLAGGVLLGSALGVAGAIVGWRSGRGPTA
jgi:hypothetical protein